MSPAKYLENGGAVHLEYLKRQEWSARRLLVARLEHTWLERRMNINDLKSTVKASTESGSSIYMMDIAIQAPAGMSPAQLEGALREVADELHVDIALSV